MVRETLSCLAHANPGADTTPADLTEDMYTAAFDAWAVAKQDQVPPADRGPDHADDTNRDRHRRGPGPAELRRQQALFGPSASSATDQSRTTTVYDERVLGVNHGIRRTGTDSRFMLNRLRRPLLTLAGLVARVRRCALSKRCHLRMSQEGVWIRMLRMARLVMMFARLLTARHTCLSVIRDGIATSSYV